MPGIFDDDDSLTEFDMDDVKRRVENGVAETEDEGKPQADVVDPESAPIGENGLQLLKQLGQSFSKLVSPLSNEGDLLDDSFSEMSDSETTEIAKMNTSKEYLSYLESLFKSFEPLLKDQKYKTSKLNNQQEELSIGVLNIIEHNRAAFELELFERMNFLLSDINELIDKKLHLAEDATDYDWLIPFEVMVNVLNLLNFLYFSSREEKTSLLILWCNRADIEPSESLGKEMLSNDDYCLRPDFWRVYIKKLAMRGQFSKACDAIVDGMQKIDSDWKPIMGDVVHLLSDYDVVNFSQDNTAFLDWKQKTCALRDYLAETSFNSDATQAMHQIREVVEILSGSSHAILHNSTTWYECLLAMFLFQMPDVAEIPSYYSLALSEFAHDREHVRDWEIICMDLLEGKFLQMINALVILDKPTSTYVAVLCDTINLFQEYDAVLTLSNDASENMTIPDFLLKDLALNLLTAQETCAMGIGLWVLLKYPETRQVLTETLPRFEIRTNDDLEWCLSVCSMMRLPATSSQVLINRARRCEEEGLQLESLTYYSKAGALKQVRNKCWLIFENALIEGKEFSEDIINKIIRGELLGDDEIVLDQAVRQCLAPYAVLIQYYDLKGCQKDTLALQHLMRLMDFPHLPAKYFSLLIAQFLPFVLSHENHFTSQEICAVIQMINRFERECQEGSENLKEAHDLYLFAKSEKYLQTVSDTDWRRSVMAMGRELPDSCENLNLVLRKELNNRVAKNFLTI